MTQEDLELFKEFQKNYVVFKCLVDGRVFEVRNGCVEIHFNSTGQVSAIRANIETYKSR